MKVFRAVMLGALSVTLSTVALCQEEISNAKSQNYTVATATVKEVLRTSDNGYQSVVYVVDWKGSNVGVIDPLSSSTHQVGDTIKFMASRWHPADKDEPKVMRFTLLEPPSAGMAKSK